MLFYSNNSCLFSPCISCNEDSHTLPLCPLLTYIPKKPSVISKLTFSCPQVRKMCFRRTHKVLPVLKNIARSRLAAYKIRFNPWLVNTFKSNLEPNRTTTSDHTSTNREIMINREIELKKKTLYSTIDSLSLQSFRDILRTNLQ